jgi:glutamate racemase
MMNHRPIGIFDSGVGGLSVLREVVKLLPAERLIYLADQANVPYGHRPLREVRGFADAITRFFLAKGCKLVVVACHTASGAALYHLRETFPQVPFVGIEPAVKPAAQHTRKKTIGVLATATTFEGPLYAKVVENFARDVRVLTHTCPGLVERIEAGDADGAETRALLEGFLRPLLAEGIDSLVLGCTHYPFALEAIREIAGPGVELLDPCPAVAKQVKRVLEECGGLARGEEPAEVEYFTSAHPERLGFALEALLGQSAPVRQARWDKDRLVEEVL